MCTRPAAPAGQCLTCPDLQKQMNTSGNGTGAPSYQGWDVRCDLCQEADNFTKSHKYRVKDITTCAATCAQYGNCTVQPDCCRAFTYLPMVALNDTNCFLSSGQNGSGTNATLVNATLFKAGDCVGAALVTPPPTGSAPATKTCRLCKEFREDLTQSGFGNWSLHCHVDIQQNDMGLLPDMPGLVDNIAQCAELCNNRPCSGSKTANYSSAFCCQAFTFVYDEVYDQNCYLKGGLTLQSVKLNMTKQWNSRRGCVNTMSAWPMSFDWCQADPQCAEAKVEAAEARANADKALQQSVAGLVVAVVSFVLAAVAALPTLINWVQGKPGQVEVASPVKVSLAGVEVGPEHVQPLVNLGTPPSKRAATSSASPASPPTPTR